MGLQAPLGLQAQRGPQAPLMMLLLMMMMKMMNMMMMMMMMTMMMMMVMMMMMLMMMRLSVHPQLFMAWPIMQQELILKSVHPKFYLLHVLFYVAHTFECSRAGFLIMHSSCLGTSNQVWIGNIPHALSEQDVLSELAAYHIRPCKLVLKKRQELEEI